MDDGEQSMELCCTETSVTEMEIKSENIQDNSYDIQPVATMNTDIKECCIILQKLETVAIKSENDIEESQNFPTISSGEFVAVKIENDIVGDIEKYQVNKFPAVSSSKTIAVKIKNNMDGDSGDCLHTISSFPSNETVEVKIKNDIDDVTFMPLGDKIDGNEVVGIKANNAGVDYMEVDRSLFSVNDIFENRGTDEELDEKQTKKTAVVNIENGMDDPSQESIEHVLGNVQNHDCIIENRNINGQDNIVKNVIICENTVANKHHLSEKLSVEKGRNGIKNQTEMHCAEIDHDDNQIIENREEENVAKCDNISSNKCLICHAVLDQNLTLKKHLSKHNVSDLIKYYSKFDPNKEIQRIIPTTDPGDLIATKMDCAKIDLDDNQIIENTEEDNVAKCDNTRSNKCLICHAVLDQHTSLEKHLSRANHNVSDLIKYYSDFDPNKEIQRIILTPDPGDLIETKMDCAKIDLDENQVIENTEDENVTECNDIIAKECLICHAVLDQNMSLEKHLSRANHDVSDLMKYYSNCNPNKKQQMVCVCGTCFLYFESKKTLQKHHWEDHRKNRLYCCSCCYYSCKKLSAIINHSEETGHRNLLIVHESGLINSYYDSSLKSLKIEFNQSLGLIVSRMTPAIASGLKEIFQNSSWKKIIVGSRSVYYFNIKGMFEKMRKQMPATISRNGEYNGKKSEKNQSGIDDTVKRMLPSKTVEIRGSFEKIKKQLPSTISKSEKYNSKGNEKNQSRIDNNVQKKVQEMSLSKTVEIGGSHCKKKQSIKDNVKKIKSEVVRVKSSTEIRGFNGEKNVETSSGKKYTVCSVCSSVEYSKLIRYHTWYHHIMNKVEWFSNKNLSCLRCQLCISKKFDSSDSYKQHMRSHILDPDCKLIVKIVYTNAQCGFSTALASLQGDEVLATSSNKQSESSSSSNVIRLNFESSSVGYSKQNISDPSNLQEIDETAVSSSLNLQGKDSHILSDNCDDGIRLPAPICLKDNTEISPSSDGKFSQSDDLQDGYSSNMQFPHDQREIPQNKSKDSDLRCDNFSKKTGEKAVGHYFVINLKNEYKPGKQLFKCDICDKQLNKGPQSQNAAISHVRFYHHGDKNGYYCKSCEEFFSQFGSYLSHLKSSKYHQNDKNKVDTTNMSQIFQRLLQDQSEFISTEMNQSKCTYCKKSFLSKKSCRIHEKYRHERKCMSVNDETTVFRCGECGKICKTIGALKMHVQLQNHVTLQTKKIKKDKKRSQNRSTNAVPSDKKVKNSRFLCQYCGKNFKYPTNHMYQCHSDKMVHKCEQCGKGFLTEKSYNIHRETLCYKCDTCGYICKSKWRLTEHIQSHLGLKPRMCIDCNKPFYSLTDFLKHRTACSKLKRFICDICGKRYRFNFSLRKHIATHKWRTVQCRHCDKLLYHKWDLELHLSIHHKVGDSILCDKCGKMLRYSQAFDHHKKICK